uniref:Opine dehydrogenase domain-containing protein n=1 Tax=Minutocellus polymorphus TaxID=265543 RepID=A0A7S0ASB5_9STRA
MKVLLCGGGNAIHVLSSYVSALSDTHVTVLSLFPGEAERLAAAIPDEGIRCINDLGDDVNGKPDAVTDKPESIPTDLDLVIFALPSFVHELYLKTLKPYLKEGVTIGAMPAEGGFDLCAIHNLGSNFVRHSNLFALETLPWACRIIEYGKSVEVLGTKKEVEVIVSPKHGTSKESVTDILHRLVGKLPVFDPASNFLGVTLMNINSVWHPTISYGFYRNRDVNEPFDEPPLFYQGADEYTGEKLGLVSDEVLEVKRVLLKRYPTLNLDSLHHVSHWMLTSYGDDIGDKTSIYTMLRTNKGYRGLTHPMREVEIDGQKKYTPNFKYRYFTEDIPMGLVVTRGIAELAGVPTPHMDDVIVWCSQMIGKQYLVEGKLTGKDLHSTRAPQHYGYTDLDKFMEANHYLDAATGVEDEGPAVDGAQELPVSAQ